MKRKNEAPSITRRELLKSGAILGATAVGSSILGGCTPQASGTSSKDETSTTSETGTATTDITYPVDDYSDIKSKDEAAEAGHYDFKYVNQPITLGGLTLKNRIIKSASSGFEASGTFDSEVDYFRQIAKGGASMIVYAIKNILTSSDEAAKYAALTEAVHEEDVPIFVQFVDEEPLRSSTINLNAPLGKPLANAEMAEAFGKTVEEITKEIQPGTFVMMTTEQVQEKIEAFAQDAVLLQAVGFDGIEINAAAEHFFDSFLSRFWNQERTDQYGNQSLENRARIVTELIARIHELCGSDFPVGVLYNGYEVNGIYPGDDSLCSDLDETRGFAKIFEAAGASHLQIRSVIFGNHCAGFFPDLLFLNNKPDTTYGHYYDIKRWWPDFNAEYGGAGAFLDTAAKIKEVVSIPVMVVGMEDFRLLPDVLDNAIGDGKIDIVAVTRRIMADFDYPNKVLAGNLDDIRPCANCINCLQGYCRVNPSYGRGWGKDMPEGFTPTAATTIKKILIAGGGPAGLEAARVASERGHSVTICEKEGTWGGRTKMAIAIKGPHEKIQDQIDWLVRQCENNGVTMNLNTEVTADMVKEIAPDVLIAATGGTDTVPDVSGVNNSIVSSDYLADGENVVVLGGLECIGPEVAIYLAEQGKKVTLIDELAENRFGYRLPVWVGNSEKYYCQTHGVRILSGVTLGKINDDGITVTLSHDNIEETVDCDNIVLAYPFSTDSSLLDAVGSSVAETYSIGDCSEQGLIREAVREANLLARKL